MTTVKTNKVVSIEYELKDADGDLLQASDEADPLHYLHGSGSIVPGLERALEGKTVGTKIEVEVSPEDGYGEREGPGPQAWPRDAFGDDDEELLPGMAIIAEDEEGDQTQLWIIDIEEDEIIVDTDHPLAGETLHFAVEIVGLRDATPDEIEHGHVHEGSGQIH